MAENGILDYQGMNQAIYRGATSNIIVDTQSMSIEIGAGNSSHTSNLHIECDHAANVASIQLNSNVVTEFSRSKKLIKYPRVAIANGNTMASGAGVQTPGLSGSQDGFVATSSSNWGGGGADSRAAWCAFDEGTSSTTHKLWQSGNYYTTATPGVYNRTPPQSHTADGVNYEGEWIKLELPHRINVSTIEINSAAYTTLTGHHTARPYEGAILGSDNNTNWSLLKSFSGGLSWTTTTVAEGGSRATLTPDANTTNYYKYLMLVVNKNQGSRTTVDINEIRYYGIPEYDPEAHGTDVTVKSVPNVPNTDWLEVYYDGQDYTDMPATVDNKTGVSTYDATPNGGVGFDATQKAFTFDAASSQYLSSSTPVDGNYIHSISIWFKGTNLTPAAGDTLMWIGDNVNNERIEIYLESDKINYSFKTNDVVADIPLLNNRWYHLTVTYNGVAGVSGREIYLDGVKQPTTHTGNSAVLAVDNNTLNLGGFSGTSTTYMFSGSIANFRLFNRALTSDEIYQLYAYQKEDFGHGDLSMTLKAGRLGIGTSEPRAALDVRGTLKVNGPATFTGRPNFTESLFFYTGNTPTNYYASTYKNRHGFYLNTLIPPNSHIGNYGTGGDNQVFTESSYGGSNELCGSHFDYMVYWLKNAPVGHVHRLNWCSNNGSGGSQTYGQKTSGTQIRLWGYWFHTGTYDKDWTGGVDFNISTSTVSVFYEGATFQ